MKKLKRSSKNLIKSEKKKQELNSRLSEQISLRKKKASLTRIREILREVQFNPKTAGTMRIVSESQNSQYFETRAIEEIREARATIQSQVTPDLVSALYAQRIRMAIRLLVLAMIEES